MDDGLALARELVRVDGERRELNDRLKVVNEEVRQLKKLVFAAFEAAGVKRVTVDGMTCYVQHRIAAKLADGADRDSATVALEQWRPELVSKGYNTNTLSAYIRELFRTWSEGQDEVEIDGFVLSLPAQIREVFAIDDWYDMAVIVAE